VADDERGWRPEIDAAAEPVLAVMERAVKAALASYVATPDDEAAAARAVAAAVGWAPDRAERLIASMREQLAHQAGVVRAALQAEAAAAGVDLRQLADLKALKAGCAARVTNRAAPFLRELARRVPPGKRADEVLTPEALDRLAREYGLTLGPAGEPGLAEDAS
jgi:hypothetical protein